jgi:hypothetical protein
MEARIVREELSRCQRAEGVNHYESCQHLAERYLTMLKENRVRDHYSTYFLTPSVLFLGVFGPRALAVSLFDLCGHCLKANVLTCICLHR